MSLDPEIRKEIEIAVNKGYRTTNEHLDRLESSFEDVRLGQEEIKRIALAFSEVVIQNGIGNRVFKRSEFDTMIYKDLKARPTVSDIDQKFVKYHNEMKREVEDLIEEAPRKQLSKTAKLFKDWKEIFLFLSLVGTWLYMLFGAG